MVKKRRKRSSPALRLDYLESTAGIRAIPAGARLGEARALRRERRRVVGSAPSGTWMDDWWYAGVALPVGWRACRCCTRLTPAPYLSSQGVCYDCVTNASPEAAEAFERSPSGIAIETAAIMGIRIRSGG